MTDAEAAACIFRDLELTEFEPDSSAAASLQRPGLVLLCRELERKPHIYRWEIVQHFDAPENALEVAKQALAEARPEASRLFAQIAVIADAAQREMACQAVALICKTGAQ